MFVVWLGCDRRDAFVRPFAFEFRSVKLKAAPWNVSSVSKNTDDSPLYEAVRFFLLSQVTVQDTQRTVERRTKIQNMSVALQASMNSAMAHVNYGTQDSLTAATASLTSSSYSVRGPRCGPPSTPTRPRCTALWTDDTTVDEIAILSWTIEQATAYAVAVGSVVQSFTPNSSMTFGSYVSSTQPPTINPVGETLRTSLFGWVVFEHLAKLAERAIRHRSHGGPCAVPLRWVCRPSTDGARDDCLAELCQRSVGRGQCGVSLRLLVKSFHFLFPSQRDPWSLERLIRKTNPCTRSTQKSCLQGSSWSPATKRFTTCTMITIPSTWRRSVCLHPTRRTRLRR